jgi:ATP-dependent DNA helicase RecG
MNLSALKGVGPKTANLLNAIDVHSVEDILFHLPFRYQDRTRVVAIADLRPGDSAVLEGVVQDCSIKFARKRQLVVSLEDASGVVQLKFFHFNAGQQRALAVGTKLRCFGEVKLFGRQLQIIHPEYRPVDAATAVEESLTPVYPTTDGLQQKLWRKLTAQALNYIPLATSSLEILPAPLRERWELPNLIDCLHHIHRPAPDADQNLLLEGLHPWQQRLAFEELLAHQVSLQQLREKTQRLEAHACDVEKAKSVQQKFSKALPFSLTQAQQIAWQEISADLTQAHPMMRLVQGDVGSGKTVVAAFAALQAIASGFQVAIMAPTELLAEQHFEQFTTWFSDLGITTAWLAGKLKVGPRREMLALIESGEAKCVVGTHALFQKKVTFNNLALIVIDEQHRFGVAQRQALRSKGIEEGIFPHQLIMTATPIPRTLAMTVYADLDTSVIDELPPGRTPIKTVVINNQRRAQVVERIQSLCVTGGQVYWVCPLIEESEQLDCEAAESIAVKLTKKLPELNVGLVHGRMKPEQKQLLMQQFKAGEIDVLVATTVIEVGINVPNATLMVIENTERMGLAQLHQLRGRVGRGAMESHCVLLYQEPLTDTAKKRLTVLRDSTDGFYIAEQDLKFRGPGEVLGTKQTGMQRLRIADIMRDRKLLAKVQQASKMVVNSHPELIALLTQRWLGSKHEFGKV